MDRVPPRWQYFLNPWWRERRTYFSQLPVDDCRRRLSRSTTLFLGRTVGRSAVSLADFTLHRVTFYANGNKPYAYVSFTEAAIGGTLVKVSMSATLFGRVFFVLWFGFLLVFTLLGSSAVLQQGAEGLIFPLWGLGIAGAGLAFNAFGRMLAYGDPAFLLGFLQQELQLKPPPPGLLPIA